jgi:hypothetical protein
MPSILKRYLPSLLSLLLMVTVALSTAPVEFGSNWI